MNGFWEFVFRVGKDKRKADEIRADEGEREINVSFGVRSIVLSLSALLFAVAWFFVFKTTIDAESFVITVLLICVLIVLGLSALMFLIHATIQFAFQLRINRNPIGWAALGLLVIAIAGIGVAAFLIL